jgi:hypothetical protein
MITGAASEKQSEGFESERPPILDAVRDFSMFDMVAPGTREPKTLF